MAKLVQMFDATKIDPSQGAGQLPVGRHKVVIVGSDVKAAKSGNSGFLELELQVIEGDSSGVCGAYRINLYNENTTAVEIASKKLSAVCHVTGQLQIADTAQLHGIPFIVEVAKQPNNDKYTEVKKVFDVNGNEPGQQHKPQPAQQQAPVASVETQPHPPVSQAWGGQQQAPEAAKTPSAWGASQPQAPVAQNKPAWAK